MFFTLATQPQDSHSDNSSGQQPGNGTGGEGPMDFGFYFYFCLHTAIEVATIFLNFLVISIVYVNRKKTFATPFYGLTAVLMGILLIVGVFTLVNFVLFAGFDINNSTLTFITTIVDLYTSYFAVVLIWLLGLNRMAIFVMPHFNELIFTRNNMMILLSIITVLMGLISFWFYNIIGIGMGNQGAYASNVNLLHKINLISYCIPLSSCLFYVKLYLHIRRQRRQSAVASTKEAFSKAEVNTATQGVVILVTFMLSMVMHIILTYATISNALRLYMNGLRDLVESLPQLVIPVSTILYNKKNNSKYGLSLAEDSRLHFGGNKRSQEEHQSLVFRMNI